MRQKRRREQTIFFPWERRGSLVRRLGLARARPFVLALGMATVLLVLGARERERTGVRATRANLDVVAAAVDAYRAEHDRACPPTLEALRVEGYMTAAAVDAWGRPLRLFCPGRRDEKGYELMSDGPDGQLGGLDRIE